MLDADFIEIKGKITAQHEGDEKQLEVIFSDNSRVIVEAPAGYGKTTTMISRIAYLFISGRIPNPKRILGLTFSVNSALKIKRDVAEKLPVLLGTKNNPVSIGEKVTVTNYHGFCKIILKKYGYLIADTLRKDVNLFRAVSDGDIERHSDLKKALTSAELQILKKIEITVKNACEPTKQEIHEYNNIIIKKFLPLDYITYNAVILFVLEIFEKREEVKKFYQSYYPLIVVDEFQDTNCIAWMLLKTIISDSTQLLFLGDSLQRIYGFIGALPDIMSKAAKEYQMTKIILSQNYRFRSNPEMLKLDKNLRANANSLFKPIISDSDVAKLPILCGSTQQEEAKKIITKIQMLINKNKDVRIAILFHNRGKNAEIMEMEFIKNNIPYFYGMFNEEDSDYVEFHHKCQDIFIKRFSKFKSVNKRNLIAFSDSVKSEYATSSGKTVDSLLQLLDALVEKVTVDYADIPPEDKYNLLLDIFENRQLKQAMEYVKSPVILSTVHGSKGLEWDYVFVADVEKRVFTFACRNCPNFISHDFACRLNFDIPEALIKTLIDDFCVFYVAMTRAKKQAFISASREWFNAQGKKFTDGQICCFALVNGVELVVVDEFKNN